MAGLAYLVTMLGLITASPSPARALPVHRGSAGRADSVQEAAAQRSAEAWLRLIDGAQYDMSWDSAAAVFRQAIAKSDWGQAVKQVRGQYDPLAGRTLKARKALASPPHAPAGDYVIIQYATSGAGQPLIETITMCREGTGWRTAGYYIKPG
jgi:hypothetical protein